MKEIESDFYSNIDPDIKCNTYIYLHFRNIIIIIFNYIVIYTMNYLVI